MEYMRETCLFTCNMLYVACNMFYVVHNMFYVTRYIFCVSLFYVSYNIFYVTSYMFYTAFVTALMDQIFSISKLHRVQVLCRLLLDPNRTCLLFSPNREVSFKRFL